MLLSGRLVGKEVIWNVLFLGNNLVNKFWLFFCLVLWFLFFWLWKVFVILYKVLVIEKVVFVLGNRIWIVWWVLLINFFGFKIFVKVIGRYNLVNGRFCVGLFVVLIRWINFWFFWIIFIFSNLWWVKLGIFINFLFICSSFFNFEFIVFEFCMLKDK